MPAPAERSRGRALRAAGAGLLALLAASSAGACRFTAGGGTLNFGRRDPAEGGEVQASVQLTVSDCPARELAHLSVDVDSQPLGAVPRQRQLQRAGGPAIPYVLSRQLGGVTPRGRSFILHAVIPAGAYSRARAGAYEDQLTVCVTP